MLISVNPRFHKTCWAQTRSSETFVPAARLNRRPNWRQPAPAQQRDSRKLTVPNVCVCIPCSSICNPSYHVRPIYRVDPSPFRPQLGIRSSPPVGNGATFLAAKMPFFGNPSVTPTNEPPCIRAAFRAVKNFGKDHNQNDKRAKGNEQSLGKDLISARNRVQRYKLNDRDQHH